MFSNKKESNKSRSDRTVEKLAGLAGVGKSTVERAMFVKEKGTQEDVEEVRKGTSTVNGKVEEIKKRGRPVNSDKESVEDKKGDKDSWVKLLKWSSSRKWVTAEDLSEKSGTTTRDCQRKLVAANQSKGFLVQDKGDGRYQVRRAVHFIWEEQGELTEQPDLKDLLRKLRNAAETAISIDNSSEWTRQQRFEFLQEILKITSPLVGSHL